MSKTIYCLLWMTCLSLSVYAQKGKVKATKKVSASSTSSPKRVPGTEGKDAHPEAALNSPLPAFKMMHPDQTLFTDQEIPAGNSVLFMMFNPTCDHCIQVGKELAQKLDSIKNTTLVLLTFTSNFNDLNAYIQTSGLMNKKEIHVGVASDQFILSHFMPNYVIPQVMVYNKKKKLKKIFYQDIDVSEVIRCLNLP